MINGELIEKYINKRLIETNNNYPRVLGNIQTLLVQALDNS